MSSVGWDKMAEWWDGNLGEDGDLWHRTLIDPPLLRLTGDVNGLRVLDLACGNGYLSRRFARQGARVVGADATAAIIERARAREAQEPLGIVYHVLDAANLEPLAGDSFDLVICNMALMDIENAAGAIQEVARVLRPRGRFVASLSHPCFDKVETSGWDIEYVYPTTTIWRKMSRYREIAATALPWLRIGDQTVYTQAYHRPLSWYFRELRAAGLLVAALEEPEPTEEFLANSQQGPWIAEIPLHCVLEAWKVTESEKR
ncbi:MAG TPA: methyltransferase domain-containing protein [Ktedonobacterales bacterium]|nr:methyltransferase domain-containing protein [Ktedonobacterales bacterium]